MQIRGNTILITGGAPVSGVVLRRLFTPKEIKLLSRGGAKSCSTKQ